MQNLFYVPISLNITSSKFIQDVAYDRISFLWLNNIWLYVCTTFSLFIHLLMYIYIAFMSFLLWIMLQWTQCKYLFKILISIILDKYSELDLLSHMVVLYLIFFLRKAILFSIVAAYFTFPPTVHNNFNFFTSSPILVIFWGSCLLFW